MNSSARNLIALSIAGVLTSGVAHAQTQASSVQLYGVVGLYLGKIQRSGQPSVVQLGHGGLTTSYFGMRGSEDLGAGLKAVFALEAFFQPDNGAMGRTAADPIFSRNSYVGLQGSFGRATVGRQTNPTYVNMGMVSAFGGSTVFSPLVLQSFVATYDNAIIGDTVWNNAIQYTSPRWNGFSVTGLYGLGESSSGDRSNVGLHANYVSGGLTAVLSTQRVRTPVTAPLSEQKATLLGAAYDFKVVKVFGAHVRTEAEGTHNETRISSLGVRVPVGRTDAVMAEWSRAHRDAAAATTRNTASLGYDHVLSKRTNVYVVYGRDRLSGRDTGNSYAVGIRHSF